MRETEADLQVLNTDRYQADQRVKQLTSDIGTARQALTEATIELGELTAKNPVSRLRNREQIDALTNTKTHAEHVIKISEPRLVTAVGQLDQATVDANTQREVVVDARARLDQASTSLEDARTERLACLMDSPSRVQPVGPHPVLEPEGLAELFKQHEHYEQQRTRAVSDLAQARSDLGGITRRIEGWQTQVDALAVAIKELTTEINELSAGPFGSIRNRHRISELEELVGLKVMKKQGLEGDILGAQPELEASTKSVKRWVGSVERSTQKLAGIDSQLDADAVNRGLNVGATNWAPTTALDNLGEPTSKNLGAWTKAAGIVEQTQIAHDMLELGSLAYGHGVERQALAINRFEQQHSPVLEQGRGIEFGGISR